MLRKNRIPVWALAVVLGLPSCEKHEEALPAPKVEEILLTVTTRSGTVSFENANETITLIEGESGKISLSFNNDQRRIEFDSVTPAFEDSTVVTPPDVIRKGEKTFVNIYFTKYSEGFVTYNLRDVYTNALVKYTYLFDTRKEDEPSEETHNNEEGQEDEDEDEPEEEEQEDTPPLHLTIKNSKYLLKETSLTIDLTCNQEIDQLHERYSFSVLIDNKEAEHKLNAKNEKLVFKCSALPQETGKHDIKVIATPTNEKKRDVTLEAMSVFYIVQPEQHWFRDNKMTSEMYYFHDIYNTMENKSSWLLTKLEGTDDAQPTVSVEDLTDGKDLKKNPNNVFILQRPSRGEHSFLIKYELEEFTTSVIDVKKVKDEYVCSVSIDGSSIYATLTGPNGNTADFTTDFTFHAVARAVIPYTNAASTGDYYYEEENYEYVNFQWVGTDFTQWNGTGYGTFTLHKGWINAALSWTKAKMSGVSASTNGASRWVNRSGTMVKEYYTPTPYLQVAAYVKAENHDGNNLDYVYWSFDFEKASSWLKEKGIAFQGYLL